MRTANGRPFAISLKAFLVVLFVLTAAAEGSSPSPGIAEAADVGQSVSSPTPLPQADPDNDPDATRYSVWQAMPQPGSRPPAALRLAAVLKFFGNPYDQQLAYGMAARAEELGLYIDIQAGATESDNEGQRAVMDEMVNKGYNAILISPQTDTNLSAAVHKARKQKIVVVNVDDAVDGGANCFVGPNQFENGVQAARYFMLEIRSGGKVAVIRGYSDDYGAEQRTRGFVETLDKSAFQIVAQVACAWDLQMALLQATRILEQHPDLVGIFGNNDIMALGASQAVKAAGKSGQVLVVGRDGIKPALESILSGGMKATVDTMALEMGRIAVDAAVSILQGHHVPAVVVTPQRLVTKDNVAGVLTDDRQAK